MALNTGTKVAVRVGTNYYEGTVEAVADSPQSEMIVKVNCAVFTNNPAWLQSANVFEIEG